MKTLMFEVEHVNGVDWMDAPTPRRWHRCKAQTKAAGIGLWVERCACGGMRLWEEGSWTGRNSKGPTHPKTLAQWVELHKDLQAMTLQQWINRRRK